ncbi:MAG: hypothetical protein HUU47_06055 [Bacteroidetes bacterium]|nr:hypothetical protein [Bacteroidota bacterium]
MKKLSLIIILLSVSKISNAGYVINDYLKFIGKRVNENPLENWLDKNNFKKCYEEFIEEGPSINFKNFENGYTLNFDINLVLYSITFYDKGSRFSRFMGSLPYNFKFGMNKDSLYKNCPLKLEETDNNPYILIYRLKHSKIELYFGSKGLNQVYISPLDSMPQANDNSFVRLIANGNKVTGDCDTSEGEMTWNDGSATYIGNWKNKMPHGKGKFKDKFNNTYEGDFKYGYFWGNGKMKVAGYYYYNGDFLISRRHGFGTCNFEKPKGEKYEGQWHSDKMSGLGKYIKNSNFYYYGNLKNNLFNGKGKLTTSEGWIEGEFTDGIPNGYMVQYIKLKNLTIEGNWVNGKRNGKFKITDIETKKISYKNFENDIEMN